MHNSLLCLVPRWPRSKFESPGRVPTAHVVMLRGGAHWIASRRLPARDIEKVGLTGNRGREVGAQVVWTTGQGLNRVLFVAQVVISSAVDVAGHEKAVGHSVGGFLARTIVDLEGGGEGVVRRGREGGREGVATARRVAQRARRRGGAEVIWRISCCSMAFCICSAASFFLLPCVARTRRACAVMSLLLLLCAHGR